MHSVCIPCGERSRNLKCAFLTSTRLQLEICPGEKQVCVNQVWDAFLQGKCFKRKIHLTCENEGEFVLVLLCMFCIDILYYVGPERSAALQLLHLNQFKVRCCTRAVRFWERNTLDKLEKQWDSCQEWCSVLGSFVVLPCAGVSGLFLGMMLCHVNPLCLRFPRGP